jgi:periplasmic protein TonB
MFTDSLFELSWTNPSRRGWTTLASFAAQMLGVGVLLMLPLIYNQALPQLRLSGPDLIAPPPGPAAPPMHARSATSARSNVANDGSVIEPTSIPREIESVVETAPPPPVDLAGVGVQGSTGGRGALNSVMNSIGNALNSAAPPPPPSVYALRRSVMMEGNLVHRVQPEYPALARSTRIQGQVLLRAVISREGTIENLQVLAGHPMLVRAAIDAVRQWRYRPYILNGEPVEVETQVTVNFILSGG